MPITYTVKQIAEILGFSTNTIYSFLKRKKIQGARIGKGRFRIPETEVQKILHLTKTTPVQPLLPQENVENRQQPENPLQIIELTSPMPSLFDWFIGIASIVFGVSMSLFTAAHDSVPISSLLSWSLPLKTALICAGLGILISDVTGKNRSFWHKAFRLILFISYSFIIVFFLLTRDFQGALMFASFAAALLITLFLNLRGIKSFIICLFAVIITFPLGIATTRNIPLAYPFNLIYSYPLWFLLAATVFNVAAMLFLFIYKYKTKRFFCLLITAVFVLIFSVLSILYAKEMYWNRALLLLLASLVSIFIPWWESFHSTTVRGKMLMVAAFGSILGVFIVTIIVILLMQKNTLELANIQIKNKADYGKLTLENSVRSIHNSLESVRQNSLLINHLEDTENPEQKQNLTGFARLLFETNRNIRRLIILDKEGNELAHYPYSTQIENQNFSYREYYQKTVATKKPYISDIFETVINIPAIVISIPVLDNNDEIIGLILGSLNTEKLGMNLEEIAAGEFEEYFTVTDSTGKYVYHHESNLIGTVAPDYLNGFTTLQETATFRKENNLVSIKKIQLYSGTEEKSWTLSIQSSLKSVLRPTSASILSLYSAVVFVVVIIILILFIVHVQKYRQYSY